MKGEIVRYVGAVILSIFSLISIHTAASIYLDAHEIEHTPEPLEMDAEVKSTDVDAVAFSDPHMQINPFVVNLGTPARQRTQPQSLRMPAPMLPYPLPHPPAASSVAVGQGASQSTSDMPKSEKPQATPRYSDPITFYQSDSDKKSSGNGDGITYYEAKTEQSEKR